MSYDAGINLALESSLRNAGKIDKQMSNYDILGNERNNKEIPIGAYGYILESVDIMYGVLKNDGLVGIASPIIPRIDTIANSWIRNFYANSAVARVIELKVTKIDKVDRDSIKVRFTLVKKDKSQYNFKSSVDLTFYKNGDEKGKFIFQSMTDTKGKAVLFSSNEEDIGNYEEAIVLCIKKSTDRFYYQIIGD